MEVVSRGGTANIRPKTEAASALRLSRPAARPSPPIFSRSRRDQRIVMVKLSSGRPAGAIASPLTPPPKHSRPLEGMLHRTAALAGFQARGLQLVVPLGGSVGVIQQHQGRLVAEAERDRKSTRLNSSHVRISYAVFCLKKK